MSHCSERRALRTLVSDQAVFFVIEQKRDSHTEHQRGHLIKMENVPFGIPMSAVGRAVAVAMMAAVIAAMEKRILMVEMMVLS